MSILMWFMPDKLTAIILLHNGNINTQEEIIFQVRENLSGHLIDNEQKISAWRC